MNFKSLFDISHRLYYDRQLHDDLSDLIDIHLPDGCTMFICRDKQFLYPHNPPSIEPEDIRTHVGFDTAGFFRFQASSKVDSSTCQISATFLGQDHKKRDLTIGMIYSESGRKFAECEAIACDTLNRLKRFYTEFSSSEIIHQFFNTDSQAHVVLDEQNGEIIFGDISEQSDRDRLKAEKVSEAGSKAGSGSLDLDNMEISNILKCTLLNNGFKLLTINTDMNTKTNKDELATIIRSFSHKIRSKIGALQAAASQLEMQEGDTLTADDIELLAIIRRAAESVENHIERLNQFAQLKIENVDQVNLNNQIKDYLNHLDTVNQAKTEISLELDDSIGEITGDQTQIKNMIKELIDNAISGETDNDVRITTIQNKEKVSLIIKNRFNANNYAHEFEEDKLFEPFYTLNSERAGMGLTMARKIVENHNGEIRIKRHSDNEMEVDIDFPLKKKVTNQ